MYIIYLFYYIIRLFTNKTIIIKHKLNNGINRYYFIKTKKDIKKYYNYKNISLLNIELLKGDDDIIYQKKNILLEIKNNNKYIINYLYDLHYKDDINIALKYILNKNYDKFEIYTKDDFNIINN